MNYLRRNIKHIERILERISTDAFPYRIIRQFLVIKELYRQQRQVFEKNERKVEDRIVSVTQLHIRPIVRGKAGTPVEFGAKVSISLSDGFSFIDRFSWDSFNEPGDLISQVENYKELGIRMTGKPLGRPPVENEENREKLMAEIKQRYQDDIDRIAVEGCIGVAKRKYGLGLIKSNLRSTSETEIFLSVFVMNLDKICSAEMAEIRDEYRIKRKRAA